MKIRSFSTPGIIDQDFVYAGSTYAVRTRQAEYQVATRRLDGSTLAFASGHGIEDGSPFVRVSLGAGRFGEGGRVLGAFRRTEEAGPMASELEALLRAGRYFERRARAYTTGKPAVRQRHEERP
jgi:hypothetical protein